MMDERILCVDDEPNVLNAYRRGLRTQFHIETAEGGAQALEMIGEKSPYAVIISDMRMPGMDGVQLLKKVKELSPNTVRIMLTGHVDQQTAIDAVNEGSIFRFLNKPCPPETVAQALTLGIEQYRLITAEQQLLQNTLRGSIKVLTDLLSLVNPKAFGHASRVRRVVQSLCKQLQPGEPWEFEVAAMLSQIGCVTLPTDIMDKAYHGLDLTDEESQMLNAHPGIGRDLVANIPRLERVAEAIAYQMKNFDGTGFPDDAVVGEEIPLGARVLKVALDYDSLKHEGATDVQALEKLRERTGCYDSGILATLEAVSGLESSSEIEEVLEVKEVGIKDLDEQMILAEDVMTTDGMLLVGKGQEVTMSMQRRLQNFARNKRIEEPIRVLVQTEVIPSIG